MCLALGIKREGEIIVKKKGKNAAAVALGRRGGRARGKSLTPEQLTAIGKKGARTRWKKAGQKGGR